MRNSKVKDIFDTLNKKVSQVDVYDPLVQKKELLELYPKRSILNEMPTKKNHYDSILLTVPHKIFKDLGYKKIKELGKEEVLFYDLKNVFPKNKVDFKL